MITNKLINLLFGDDQFKLEYNHLIALLEKRENDITFLIEKINDVKFLQKQEKNEINRLAKDSRINSLEIFAHNDTLNELFDLEIDIKDVISINKERIKELKLLLNRIKKFHHIDYRERLENDFIKINKELKNTHNALIHSKRLDNLIILEKLRGKELELV